MKTEYSLQFDGSTNYVSMGDVLPLDSSQPFTVEGWINTLSGATAMICGKIQDLSHSAPGWAIFISAGKIYLQLNAGTSFGANELQVASSLTVLAGGTWNQFAITYDGSMSSSGVKMFINGYSKPFTINSDTLSGSIANTNNFTIGADGNGGNVFNGTIDEVRVSSNERYATTFVPEHSFPLSDAYTEGYWRMNEGTGTTTADSSGNGHTGLLINAPTWTAGIDTGAVAFSAPTGDGPVMIQVPNSATLEGSNFTAEAWINVTNATGRWPNMSTIVSCYSFYTAGGGYCLFLGGPSTNDHVCVWIDSVASFIEGTTSVTTNVDHHVALTFDGSNVCLWLDGNLENSTPYGGTIGYNGQAFFFGAAGVPPYDTNVVGVMDEIRISSIARYTTNFTPAQNFTIDSYTGGYWKMEELTGLTSFDSSPNHNDGTLTNSPTWVSGITDFGGTPPPITVIGPFPTYFRT